MKRIDANNCLRNVLAFTAADDMYWRMWLPQKRGIGACGCLINVVLAHVAAS
jgi:hypothetical protein